MSVRYTYQDLLSLPESHQRHEIVDGELIVTPTPRVDHQLVAANLSDLLRSHALEHGLGEVFGPMTVHLRDELVLEPDLVFITGERFESTDPGGHLHEAPDLVIEILSPSTRSYDRDLKRKHYLQSGVGELWLVHLETRSVEVWRPDAAEAERVDDVLAWSVGGRRFEIPLEAVFRGVR